MICFLRRGKPTSCSSCITMSTQRSICVVSLCCLWCSTSLKLTFCDFHFHSYFVKRLYQFPFRIPDEHALRTKKRKKLAWFLLSARWRRYVHVEKTSGAFYKNINIMFWCCNVYEQHEKVEVGMDVGVLCVNLQTLASICSNTLKPCGTRGDQAREREEGIHVSIHVCTNIGSGSGVTRYTKVQKYLW